MLLRSTGFRSATNNWISWSVRMAIILKTVTLDGLTLVIPGIDCRD